MSSKQALRLMNAMDRAKRMRYNQRILRAVRRERAKLYETRGSEANKAALGVDWATATPAQRLRRAATGYRGQGGYFMQKLFGAKKGSWLDRLGDVVTDTVLPMVPGGAAAQKAINLGGSIASSLFPSGAGMYMGQGDYTVAPAANALMAVDADHSGASTVPVVSQVGGARDGGILIRHKEYVTDVYANGLAFENGSYAINPGLERSFPWLSQVAANFTEYTMHQCIFTYKSAIAPIGASLTGQVGSIIMAAQYDVSDEPFSTKQQMLLEAGACADMLTRDMIFGIECDPKKLSGAVGKYIRSAPVITGADIKTYDHAVLNIATDSLPAGYLNQNVGELWVEYTVELRKPKLAVGRGDFISRDVWAQGAPSGGAAPLGVDAEANSWIRPFIGTQNMLRAQQSSIGTLLQNTTNTVLFPAGYAGNVRLKIYLASQSNLVFPGAPGEWAGVPGGFTFLTTGNVALIDDIPVASTTDPFNSSVQSVTFVNGVPLVCNFEIHLRIDLASNGIDNTFTFGTPFASVSLVGGVPTFTPIVTAANLVCGAATLDIEEYNTTLNYKQNGSNDGIVFVNNVSGQVENWSG